MTFKTRPSRLELDNRCYTIYVKNGSLFIGISKTNFKNTNQTDETLLYFTCYVVMASARIFVKNSNNLCARNSSWL